MNKKNHRWQITRYLAALPLLAIFIYIIAFAPHRATDDGGEVAPAVEPVVVTEVADTTLVTYAMFDPNEADYRTLVEAGVPRDIAVSIIRWRESGKVYRIKEDLALLYNMTDSLYFVLEPYIHIGDAYRPVKHDNAPVSESAEETKRREMSIELRPFNLDTVGIPYLRSVGFSYREASLVIRYRDMIGGYRCFEEFDECYAVDSVMAERLRDYIIFPESTATNTPQRVRLVEINSADSAALVALPGIGEGSVMQILRYRELLGGYHSPAQLLELDVVTAENFRKFSSQIWCDSAEIKKININFATPNEMMTHPYLSSRMLKKIINKRELKGGWSTIEEMIKDKIFSEDEASRIAPYLDFGTQAE